MPRAIETLYLLYAAFLSALHVQGTACRALRPMQHARPRARAGLW